MMGYYDEAIRDYSRGIKAFKDSSFFYNRAVIYIEQGDIEAAIADLSQAIDSYPISEHSITEGSHLLWLASLSLREKISPQRLSLITNHQTP